MSSRAGFGLRTFAAKLQGLLRGQQPDGEFDDEVEEHLQLLAQRFVEQGMSREEAAAAAQRQFGNRTRLQEDRRELQTLPWIEALRLDLRYALRTLWRSRGFAAVCIATLGLGIGASTAIFSVVDNVLLEPFPWKDAGRMVFLGVHDAGSGPGDGRQGYTSNEFLEFAEQNHVFEAVIGASEDLVLYKHGEGVEPFDGANITPGTFEFFGMPALYGRVLQPADYRPDAPPVFVLRYKTWMQRFNGDPEVLDKTFKLNGTVRTLVGIMPPRFGWFDADVYIPETPLHGVATSLAGTAEWFLLGKLKPGVSKAQAAADATAIANHLAKLTPQDYPAHFQMLVKHLGDSVVGRIEPTLYTILVAVGLLLLIGCGNVANLLLARATTREKEFALRATLGAGRARLVRLLLVESLVLAIGGAALGLLMAWGGLKSIVAALPPDVIPAESVIELNPKVLAFTLVVCVLTAVIFGLAPALQAARRDLNDPLRDSGKGVVGGFRGGRMRDAVVVIEVAVSLTLLVGAGLVMRSFVALRGINLGLQADHVLQAELPLPGNRYKTAAQVSGFLQPLLARLKALPGVVDATESTALPPYGGENSKIEISGRAHEEEWHALLQGISEGYFRVLRVPLKGGRTFSEVEITNARKVAVVNETFVSTYLRGENPVGQRVKLTQLETLADPVRDPWFEIVGIVADVTNQYSFGNTVGLQAPIAPAVWVPYTVTGSGPQVLMVRSQQTPMALMNDVRRAVWASDSDVALAFPGALQDRINQRLYAGPRFAFLLMTVFACLGLILVTMGVYSILAYATARRTNEIGIRVALGATGGDVVRMVVKTGLRLVVAGMAVGMALSLVLGRTIGAQLIGVKAHDPATLALTTLLLTGTAAVACWIPARRAARVDPTVALRYE